MSSELQITKITGFQRGKATRFVESPVVLGTADTCSLIFDPAWDKTVSAKHATVELREGDWWFIDHSEHGSWINGQRLSAARKLEPVTEIELGRGGPKIRLEFAVAPMSSPVPMSPPPVQAPVPPVPTLPASMGPVKRGSRGSKPLVLAAGIILFLGLGVAGIVFWNGSKEEQALEETAQEAPPDEELCELVEESAPQNPPPSATTPASSAIGRGWAIIAGVNQYSNGINSLAMCVNDAKAVAKSLVDSGIFHSDSVILMTDESPPELQPTSINIERMIKTVAAQAKPEDIVYFSFSGHGDWDEAKQDSMIITSDANPQNLERTTLYGATLQKLFSGIAAEKLIVVLDSCHSGGIQVKGRKEVRQAAGIPEAFYQKFTDSKGQITVRSCAFNEVSWESPELGHGLFTYHLVAGLTGAADRDGDGIATLSEVRAYVSEKVPADAVAKFGEKQTPSFTSGGLLGEVGDIPLTVIPAQRARRLGTLDTLRQRASALSAQDKISAQELDTIKDTLRVLSEKRRFAPAEQEQIKLTLRLLLGKTTAADYRLASRALGGTKPASK